MNPFLGSRSLEVCVEGGPAYVETATSAPSPELLQVQFYIDGTGLNLAVDESLQVLQLVGTDGRRSSALSLRRGEDGMFFELEFGATKTERQRLPTSPPFTGWAFLRLIHSIEPEGPLVAQLITADFTFNVHVGDAAAADTGVVRLGAVGSVPADATGCLSRISQQ